MPGKERCGGQAFDAVTLKASRCGMAAAVGVLSVV